MRLTGKLHTALMCSVAMGILAIPASAVAQEQTERGTTRLQRIVKGAGHDKVAVDTPQAVTVINQEDIDDEGAVTLGDVFLQIPGVNTSGSERVLGEAFIIRGVGSGEDQADEGRIIISVDGVDKNYQQYRMGGFFSDPELYKRVEVLRGPASSTLYGSGALAGVVVFTTKDASDFLEEGETGAVRLKAGFESNSDTLLGSAILAVRPSENVEFLVVGNRREGGDYKSGNGTLIDADFLSLSGLVKGTLRFGDNNEQTLRASYQKWSSEAENQQYAQTVNSPLFGNVDRAVTDETYILAYENPASDNDWIDFKAQVSYSDTHNEERNATVFFFGPGPGVQFFPDADFHYKTFQAKAENTIESKGEDWENYFTFGLQYTELDRVLALRSTGAQPAGTDTKIGVFFQNEYTYADKLTIIPGMRIDYRKLTPDQSVVAGFAGGATGMNDVAYSPKIAALYKFNETFSVFGSFAHTERFPTLDEVYDYRTGLMQGSSIDKEKSNNIEGGVAISLYDMVTDGDALQLKATVFRNDIEGYIYRNPAAGTSTAYTNIGDVRLYGAELEMAYSSDYWFASAGASVIRGQDVDNSISASGNLNTIPPDELFFTLGARLPDQGLKFGWKSRIVAAQDKVFAGGVSRQPSDSFSTHGMFLSWLPQDDNLRGLEFRASVDNLFDREYQEFLSNDPGKGRTFKISLVKKLGW